MNIMIVCTCYIVLSKGNYSRERATVVQASDRLEFIQIVMCIYIYTCNQTYIYIIRAYRLINMCRMCLHSKVTSILLQASNFPLQ